MGVTGPSLRASGVPFDVRKAHPYSIYPELEFEVITHQGGDTYSRYLQRIAELKLENERLQTAGVENQELRRSQHLRAILTQSRPLRGPSSHRVVVCPRMRN